MILAEEWKFFSFSLFFRFFSKLVNYEVKSASRILNPAKPAGDSERNFKWNWS